MLFEDLKESDFIEISKQLKINISMDDIKVYSKNISEKYCMPIEDATTCLFISFDLKSEFAKINHEKCRRLKQLKIYRLKDKENERRNNKRINLLH